MTTEALIAPAHLTGLIAAWVLSICSQPSLIQHPTTPSPVAYPVEQGLTPEATLQVSADVPMRVHRGLPIVDVWVNGRGPFSFGVDTGAMDPVVVGPSLADQLGFGAAVAGRRDKITVPVDSIRVGDAVFTGISAVTVDLGAMRVPFDGTLGLPFFRDFLLTLDYPASRMRIERGELPKADGKTVLPLERHPTGLAFLELAVDGDTLAALLDTGNTAAAFYLPRSLATRLRWASDSSSTRVARTLGGEITIEEVRLAGVIRLGQLSFNQPVVAFGDIFSKAVIGGQAFGEHVVSIDQRNWRLRLLQ